MGATPYGHTDHLAIDGGWFLWDNTWSIPPVCGVEDMAMLIDRMMHRGQTR
jgi:hypothetical protein